MTYRYTVSVYGTVKRTYKVEADNDDDANEEAYEHFKDEVCVDFENIETDAWFREEL